MISPQFEQHFYERKRDLIKGNQFVTEGQRTDRLWYEINVHVFSKEKSGYAGQKYCRMLHSAILLTFIKLPFVIKIFDIPAFFLRKKEFRKKRILFRTKVGPSSVRPSVTFLINVSPP